MNEAGLTRRLRKAAMVRLACIRHRRPATQRAPGPVLTISFDDVPRTAFTAGRPVLDRHGARATWYIAGGIDPAEAGGAPVRPDDLRALVAEGHEVGCHGHAHLDYQDHRPGDLIRDLDRNAAWFTEAGLPPARTFAYPYGRLTPAAKALCAARFAACRGVRPGAMQGTIDLALLPSVALYTRSLSLADTRRWIDAVADRGGVLSFFTHGVRDDPGPYDCTPEHLDAALVHAVSRGIPVLPMISAVSQVFDVG